MTTRRSVLIRSAAALSRAVAAARRLRAGLSDKPIKIIVPFPPGGPGRHRGADRAGRHGEGARPAAHRRERRRRGRPASARSASSRPSRTATRCCRPQARTRPTPRSSRRRTSICFATSCRSARPATASIRCCASKELGVKTFAEIIAIAKAKPGELKFGSVGIGSAHHLVVEMLKVCGRDRTDARAVSRRGAVDPRSRRRPHRPDVPDHAPSR